MKLIIKALFSIVFILVTASISIAQINLTGDPMWIFDSDLYVKHIMTAHLDVDGIPDIIAAENNVDYYGYPSKVYALNGENGLEMWSYTLDDGVRSMTLGDINGDGVMDVAAGASYHGSNTPDGYVHAINGINGAQLWTFYTGSTNNTITTGNLNGDAYGDVVVGSFDDYIYAIDGQTGSQIWKKLIGSLWLNDVACADVNGDNIDDVAFCHEYLAGWDNYMGLLNGSDGSYIWADTLQAVILEVLLADIDNDSQLEAIFSLVYSDDHGEIQVRNASDGVIEWSYNFGSLDHVNGEIKLYSYDLDNDGDLELVVGNYLGHYQILVFEGDVNTPMMTSAVLSGFPRELGFGDVVGDNEMNIIAATYDRVQVISAVTGEKMWYYPVGGTIASVETGDFNSDGILNVIAGGGADNSGLPPNPAKGVWALKTVESPLLWEYSFGEYGNAVAVDNLNGDEFEDVVCVNSLDDKITVVNGETGLELWNWVGTQNLYAVTTGNFNDDAGNDVAVAGNDDMISVFNGEDGEPLWQYPVGDQIYRKCLQATDLNNDGKDDVIAGSDDNTVYAIDGSTGLLLWSVLFPSDIEEIELAQMDGADELDVVVINGGSSGKMTVLRGNDGGLLWEYNINTASAKHVEVLDANGDGLPDVAIGINPSRIIMVNGDTKNELWTIESINLTYENSFAHGDFNNDGADDLVVGGSSSDKAVHVLNGLSGAELWNYPTDGEVNVVKVIDITGDGSLDVIAGSDDNNIYVLNGNKGTNLFNYSTSGDVMDIGFGDINGDGAINMSCVTFSSSGTVYAFGSFYVGSCCNSPGDANNDDVVGISDLTYFVDYLFNNGPVPVCYEEFDNNGDCILGISDLTIFVEYLFNNGPDPFDCHLCQ